ncbi:MAG: hypothetical protein KJ620_01270 [Candidatus Edwardsbacteria bacterium]|nr:hypothetical protein [Candidatus Edwardsbacteria bacterium]MBU1576995.1 hypothetical protein [Candidatus Edwardsbacteria bacterium]MBU2464117.1 hypothetical protein [Candidatus Edwardsbacteria bacterium]MBU2594828.1 hypothetical protein [Candidatus Edwardsbacteria bacterium]
MSGYQHKELAAGRWSTLSFMEQMANIGSEVERAINWKNKDNQEYSRMAINRALELLELTKSDARNVKKLKELGRLYEVLVDYFYFDNSYSSSDELWHKYFYAFNYAARVNK